MGCGGADNKERTYTDTNRDGKETHLPEYSSLDLQSAASPHFQEEEEPGLPDLCKWRGPWGGCTLDRVEVTSIPGMGGVLAALEKVNSGSSGLRTPFHPPPSLWNPLIKLGAEISALKCRLCAGIQAAAPECGGHFLGPVSLNGLFVPAGLLSIRCA